MHIGDLFLFLFICIFVFNLMIKFLFRHVYVNGVWGLTFLWEHLNSFVYWILRYLNEVKIYTYRTWRYFNYICCLIRRRSRDVRCKLEFLLTNTTNLQKQQLITTLFFFTPHSSVYVLFTKSLYLMTGSLN